MIKHTHAKTNERTNENSMESHTWYWNCIPVLFSDLVPWSANQSSFRDFKKSNLYDRLLCKSAVKIQGVRIQESKRPTHSLDPIEKCVCRGFLVWKMFWTSLLFCFDDQQNSGKTPRWCQIVEVASTRKIQTSWWFEQNHSPIPCNGLPPRIHQKLTQIVQIPFVFMAQDSGMVPRWCWMVEMASRRKIKTSWCLRQNRSPIPCQELPPRIHQKLKQIVQTPF